MSYGEIIGLACAFIWAFNGLVLRQQLQQVPPMLANAVRCGTAGLCFVGLLLVAGPPLASFGQVPAVEWALLLGSVTIGLVIGDTLYLHAIKRIGAARTLALVGIHPLTTLFFEWLLLDRLVGWSLLAGCCLVVAGVVCLSQEHGARQDRGPMLGKGALLALAAAVMWGLSTVMLDPAMRHLEPIQANCVRLPFVALVLLSVQRGVGGAAGWPPLQGRALAIVAATGLLGMGVGSWMYLTALDLIGPTKTATLSSASPVFGLVLALFFRQERLHGRLVVGVLLCVGGVWLVV
ncbi:MAG: EamA family transporter [Candidatus Latescibacteria bacterium]|nr:EamA family transporter [Candidatus Latescibacterota bacterium]